MVGDHERDGDEGGEAGDGGRFEWGREELGTFWEKCFPKHYDCYVMDGLHPKCLTSKICNDILRTNINTNSSSANQQNDRILCFEVLQNLETQLIQFGVVQKPRSKNTGNPNHVVYTRVDPTHWNLMSKVLTKELTLEKWARSVVDDSIRKLQGAGAGSRTVKGR